MNQPMLSLFFLSTLIAATGFLVYGFYRSTPNSKNRVFTFIIVVSLIILIQSVLAFSGFFLDTDTFPPNIIFAIVPSLLLILWMMTGKRNLVSLSLSLKTLTMIHIIRIPVELILHQLYYEGKVPQLMTFEGRNFDILSGISAPVIYFLAFKKDEIRRNLLLSWNIVALLLLLNIVIHAVFSVPTRFQQLAFEQPNIAILSFPYVLLPTVIVPSVLYAHLVCIVRLIRLKRDS